MGAKKKEFTIIVFCVLACFVSVATAADDWTTKNKIAQYTGSILILADCLQTLEIAKNDDYYETNPIMGRDPNQEMVVGYFATAMVGYWGISYLLTEKWRNRFQFLVIGVQAGYVCHNYNIGIRVAF